MARIDTTILQTETPDTLLDRMCQTLINAHLSHLNGHLGPTISLLLLGHEGRIKEFILRVGP